MQRTYVKLLNTELAEQMCQMLRISIPSMDANEYRYEKQMLTAIDCLKRHPRPLEIADYLLAFDEAAKADDLEAILARSKSAWTVGERLGKRGLIRRVPSGVQDALDSVMAKSQHAGVHLAKAWEKLYGLTPEPSSAYGLAVKAIEDATVPLVCPKNPRRSLGTVVSTMESQRDWSLPIDRTDNRADPATTLIAMMRMVWVGQHDRHGGNGDEEEERFSPGDVSFDEAVAAVSLAVTIVNLFDAGLVKRSGK